MSTFEQAGNFPIDLSHLSGLDYQKRVFECLVQRLFGDSRVLDIQNHSKGEVDYVVNEHPGTDLLATNKCHYFECKNYSRSLELDSVAKVMVVAVSDQPMSVHVVSRTPLQPQIKRYAARLFNFDSNTNPIFRSVVFRHWQTGSLLQYDEGEEERIVDSTAAPGFQAPKFGEVHWWLSECSAFSEVEIASSQLSRQQLEVRHGTLLTLALQTSDVGPEEISLDGLPVDSWRYVPIAESAGAGHYLIDTTHFAADDSYRVSLRMLSQGVDRRIPLVHLSINGVAGFLPELRVDEIDELAGRMGPAGVTRLTLLGGEAGVGKTHLIERVAENLRARAGFDILRFTVPESPDDELMGSIIRHCLAPVIEKSAFNDVVSKIEAVLLRQENGGSPQMDFRLLARVASQMGPRVIVLRDCHLVTPKLADEIWMLISALDDASWGGIRLVMEYRLPDANANPAWRSLLDKIHVSIRKVLIDRQIDPLDGDAFSGVITYLFTHITDELRVSLFKRTGGFPLFLESYLHRLQHLGWIRRHASGSFEISAPAAVLADPLPLGAQAILEERIRSALSPLSATDRHVLLTALGLIATTDNDYSQSLVLHSLGIGENATPNLQALLEDTGIGCVKSDGKIAFRHDLMRQALATVAKGTDGFAAVARQTADSLLAAMLPMDEVKVRLIRVRIYTLLGDHVSCELELRAAVKAAHKRHDYQHLISFLGLLLPLLKRHGNLHERLMLMQELAWASWVSESLVVARDRYRQVAAEAERNMEGDFSFSEAIATDAYRRAIGLDLELMEPHTFIVNTIAVLERRHDHLTFNSVLNRLVLFCARLGFPDHGYQFARIGFEYIGDGMRANEGSVLYSELGLLYAGAAREVALDCFKRARDMAENDPPERVGTTLGLQVHECLYHGKAFDLAAFDATWRDCLTHRLSEPLARASLLRGSLLLRDGNLKSAGHWIERTATMVQLYHLKQFELPVLNDQIVHALLTGDIATASRAYAKLVAEFERVAAQTASATALLGKVMDSVRKVAGTLQAEPSTLVMPMSPPAYCEPAAEIRGNIAAFASLLGDDKTFQAYGTENLAGPMLNVAAGIIAGEYRCVEIGGYRLILGAY